MHRDKHLIRRADPHVVLCWEYGAGLGHVKALNIIGERLQGLGWKTTLVNPSNANVPSDLCFDEILTLPTANQLSERPISDPDTPIASFNHAVWNFGFHSEKFVFTRLQLWQKLFAKTKPDLVIADFAPAALMAANGSIPCIGVGNGYTLPPVTIKRYPRFFDIDEQFDDRDLLYSVNSGLRLAGRHEISFLPEIFKADFQACISFETVDPYRKLRVPAAMGPLFPNSIPRAQSDVPQQAFVYLTQCNPELICHVICSMARLKIPAFVYSLQGETIADEWLHGSKITILEKPISLEKIISDHSLVIHLGGQLLTFELLAAGVPQLLLPIDIEKVLLGNQLEREGLATQFRVDRDFTPDRLDYSIKNAWECNGLKKRAGEFADNYPASLHTRALEKLVKKCIELVR